MGSAQNLGFSHGKSGEGWAHWDGVQPGKGQGPESTAEGDTPRLGTPSLL